MVSWSRFCLSWGWYSAELFVYASPSERSMLQVVSDGGWSGCDTPHECRPCDLVSPWLHSMVRRGIVME